jgi:hypothetical protein
MRKDLCQLSNSVFWHLCQSPDDKALGAGLRFQQLNKESTGRLSWDCLYCIRPIGSVNRCRYCSLVGKLEQDSEFETAGS